MEERLDMVHNQKGISEELEITQCIGIMLGIGIGDAKGIPFENKTYQEIRELIEKNDPKVTSIYSATTDNAYMKDYIHPPGRWTDDTQLSVAVAKSIIETGSVNIESIAAEHINAYNETTIGWGGTRDAVRRLVDKTHSYLNCGNAHAIGNGVLMKLAPLAFFYCKQKYDTKRKFEEIELLARMTHNNTEGVIAAIFHTLMLEHIFSLNSNSLDSFQSRRDLIYLASQTAKQLEDQFYKQDNDLYKVEDLLSTRMNSLLSVMDKSNNITDEDLIEISKGGTFYCINCLTMVYGLIAQQSPSFQSVLKAVFIGGDTDSNASMVGAIVGGLRGPLEFPKEYVDNLENHQLLFEIGKKLAQAKIAFYHKSVGS